MMPKRRRVCDIAIHAADDWKKKNYSVAVVASEISKYPIVQSRQIPFSR